MSLAGAWLAFPLLFAVAVTGWGLLVELVTGARVPGVLLPALGVAALGALLALTTATVHELSLPLSALGALGGLGACAGGPRAAGPALAAALG